MNKGLKILLSKKRKIKKFTTSIVEVVLFDKKNYKVAVRVIQGYSGLVDNLQERAQQGIEAMRIQRLEITGNIRTIYKLSPFKYKGDTKLKKNA